jgi:uncharacterized protein
MEGANDNKETAWLPNYRSRAVNGKVLLTADHGAWILVGRRVYDSLRTGRPSQRLYRQLEKKGLIATGSNSGLIDKYYERWTAPYYRGTTLHIIVTTRRCNLQCVYCHASAKHSHGREEDLTCEAAKKIVNFILKTPASNITIEFQGGESLLNFDIVKFIVEYAGRANKNPLRTISFSLVSNFILINNEILDYAARNNISLSTSVDGPREVHNLNRRFPNGGGTFDLVESNIGKAQEMGRRVGILTVLTRCSAEKYKEIVDHYVKMGIDTLCVNPVQMLGYARENWDDIGIECVESYLRIYRNILEYTFEYLSRGIVILDRMFLLALSKLTSGSDVGFMDFRSPCGAVGGQLAYDVNGDVYPCDEARSFPELKLGNVSSDTYEYILNSKKASEIIGASLHTDPLCNECAYKPFCGLCPVMSYAERRSLTPVLPDDLRCRFSKFLFDYVFTKILTNSQEIINILKYRTVKNAYLLSREALRN